MLGNYYRQGDVLLIVVKEIPATATVLPREDGRIVLAEGEVTGHAHAILDSDADLLSVADEADRWLRVGAGGAQVVHEEHGAIMLPRGTYRVRRQREYTPEAIRRVAD